MNYWKLAQDAIGINESRKLWLWGCLHCYSWFWGFCLSSLLGNLGLVWPCVLVISVVERMLKTCVRESCGWKGQEVLNWWGKSSCSDLLLSQDNSMSAVDVHFRAGLTSVLFSELVDRWPCSPVIPLISTDSSSPPSLWSGQIIPVLGLKMPFSIDGYLRELVHCSLLLLCLSVPAFVFSCWNSCFQFVLAARFWLEVRKENRKAGCLMNFYFQSCRNCFAVCLLAP